MHLSVANFGKRDWTLWIVSLTVVLLSNILSPCFDLLTLLAALVGVTSLIFAAKGNGWGQVLIVIFSLLYGVISYRFRYWGEMVTYLGMTMPMGMWSAAEWFRNPSEKNGNEVAIARMSLRKWLLLLLAAALTTLLFYYILRYFHTPNLFFSTVSVTTSFLAAALTILRSSYYALFYAANDLVLIVLWSMAAAEDPVYFPVIVNFAIFLLNDLYGYLSWRVREKGE